MQKNPKMLYKYVNSKKVVKDYIRALNDENGKKVEELAEKVKEVDNVFEADNGVRPDFSREKRAY